MIAYTSDPEAPWCRACAGTGIAYDAPAWAVVLLRETTSIEITRSDGGTQLRTIRGVSAGPYSPRSPEHWPFIHWIHALESKATGAKMPDWTQEILDSAGQLLCMGCHGTGRFWYADSYEKRVSFA